MLAGALPAAAQVALGNEAGCRKVLGGEGDTGGAVALMPGHLTLRDASCLVTGVQTSVLMASCSGAEGPFRSVIGIDQTPDGTGIVLTLPDDGGEEVIYPCE